jgi:hypothetical protein
LKTFDAKRNCEVAIKMIKYEDETELDYNLIEPVL